MNRRVAAFSNFSFNSTMVILNVITGLLMVGALLAVEREMLAVIHRGATSIKSAARAAGQPA